VEIVRLDPEAVRPLRQAVLRPHQRVDEVAFPGDALPGAAHFGARDGGGALLGVASVSPEPHPVAPRPGDWRVRGMATDPDGGRGRGAGALLLEACLAHARAAGGLRVWCNARSPVRGFYERAGFTVEGGEFELPGIGPHHLMSLEIG
jgi:predicted GNAT family N-acyltransferase